MKTIILTLLMTTLTIFGCQKEEPVEETNTNNTTQNNNGYDIRIEFETIDNDFYGNPTNCGQVEIEIFDENGAIDTTIGTFMEVGPDILLNCSSLGPTGITYYENGNSHQGDGEMTFNGLPNNTGRLTVINTSLNTYASVATAKYHIKIYSNDNLVFDSYEGLEFENIVVEF